MSDVLFPGQYFDQETGLHYNYFRTYDPETGRYITADPIGLRGGLNLYEYVDSNPLTYIDPNGLGKIGLLKRALEKVYKEIGGPLPKGKPGKYGSPQRGDSKKGYRYDSEGHPNSTDPNEQGPHINYWDYTKGKRGKGGKSGAIPLSGLGGTLFGEDSFGKDVVDFVNPLSDLQDLVDMINDMNGLEPVGDDIHKEFCKQNPTAPSCYNLCP